MNPIRVSPRAVPKPWGREVIWAEGGGYLGKLIRISEGESLSEQYHDCKHETLMVLQGSVRVEYRRLDEDANESEVFGPGECFVIPARTIHRISSEWSCESVLVEVSTPHPDDVVRLNDRYGRA